MPKNLKRPASVVSEPVEEADSESSKKQCSATEPLASPEVDKKLKEMLQCLSSGLAKASYASQVEAVAAAAAELMNAWDLWIAGKAFRIAEVEAYVHSPHHADPYAHGDEGQAACGVWYFHRKGGTYKSGSFKGMDLACGDKAGNVFAGLLLRAVIDPLDKLIEGPCLVVDKILELNGKESIAAFAAGRAAADLLAVSTEGLRLAPAAEPRCDPVRSSARVGLVLRQETTDAKGPKTHMQGRPIEFCTRPYRFSTVASRLTKYRSGFVATAHLSGASDGDKLGLSDQNFAKYAKSAEDGKSSGDPSKWFNKKISTQPELCELIGACHGVLASL